MTNVLVVGGTSGIGCEIAREYADRGAQVVLTGRDAQRAQDVAAKLGDNVRGIGVDVAQPNGIEAALADIARVDRLVVAAIDRDSNTVADYDVDRATRLVVLKLVGYTEVVHVLRARLPEEASVVLFGGQAKDRPYPGSTTVSTVNAGVTGLMHTLVVELAPVRVNAIHPGIVGDSPEWKDKPADVLERVRSRTPTGRTVAMTDVVGAVVFLLENPSVNGVDLFVNGGTLLL